MAPSAELVINNRKGALLTGPWLIHRWPAPAAVSDGNCSDKWAPLVTSRQRGVRVKFRETLVKQINVARNNKYYLTVLKFSPRKVIVTGVKKIFLDLLKFAGQPYKLRADLL